MKSALEDQSQRVVEVDRERLLAALIANKEKHVAEYNEAMEGYKSVLLQKIDEAFKNAKKELEESERLIKEKVENFTEEDIKKQRDYIAIVNPINVEMKVPRSFESEYNAAIAIATWDVNKTMKLSAAEFNCFVRDEWDWKPNFEAISAIYKAKRF